MTKLCKKLCLEFTVYNSLKQGGVRSKNFIKQILITLANSVLVAGLFATFDFVKRVTGLDDGFRG